MLFPPFILHVIFPESLTQHVKSRLSLAAAPTIHRRFYRNSLPPPEALPLSDILFLTCFPLRKDLPFPSSRTACPDNLSSISP